MPAPKGTGRMAKYCSVDCRRRANRGAPPRNPATEAARAPAQPAEAVPAISAPLEVPGTGRRLDYLQRHRDRLDRLLENCPADKIVPVSKEFRDVLNEIETLTATAPPEAGRRDEQPGARGGGGGPRRSFDAAAI
jgi:hypothetical protein